MFRITRGHSVQHIHFPLPVIRDLDDLDEEPTRGDASAPKAAAPEARVEADPSAEATQQPAEHLQATGYAGGARYRDEPAVTGGNLITAGGTAPLEFAREIFRKLELYDPRVLDAWYTLFKTGDPAAFYALAELEQTA